jgi:hypothetical protein
MGISNPAPQKKPPYGHRKKKFCQAEPGDPALRTLGGRPGLYHASGQALKTAAGGGCDFCIQVMGMVGQDTPLSKSVSRRSPFLKNDGLTSDINHPRSWETTLYNSGRPTVTFDLSDGKIDVKFWDMQSTYKQRKNALCVLD